MVFPRGAAATLIIPILFTVSVACSHRSSDDSSNGGGQDGGGGLVQSSTPAQVRNAIALAFKLASGSGSEHNIFIQFYLTWIFERQKPTKKDVREFINEGLPEQQLLEAIRKPKHLLPNLNPSEDLQELPAVIREFDRKSEDFVPGFDTYGQKPFERDPEPAKLQSDFIDALSKNRIVLKERGDCSQPDPKHADASVSAFNVNADICFSVGNLTRIPPSMLLSQILGLLIHETAHLGGALEPEAQLWQKLFDQYFASRFGTLSKTEVKANTLARFSKAATILASLKEMAGYVHFDPRVYTLAGEFLQCVTSMPYYLDPTMLQLSLKPDNPTLVNNYSNSVLALAQVTRRSFLLGRGDWVERAGSLNYEEFNSIVDNLIRLRNLAEKNFLKFVDDEPFVQSVCKLPEAAVDPILDYPNQGIETGEWMGNPKHFQIVAPAHQCDPGTEAE